MLKKLLIPNVMLCLLCANLVAPAFCAGISNGTTKTIQGSVTQNEMIDNLERVGIKCIFHQGTTAKTGYLAVDSIPVVDVSPKDKEKKLIQYDIELIIDVTGSMNEIDGTGELTKFQWCHEQVRSLARLMEEYKRTLTITTFNTGFTTEHRCNPSRLEELYGSIKPEGGTCLVTPLIERLEYVRTHPTPGRATIIAVITDGEPNVPRDPLVVNRALVEFTKKLNGPDDIVITFLQIGDRFNGKSFCILIWTIILSTKERNTTSSIPRHLTNSRPKG